MATKPNLVKIVLVPQDLTKPLEIIEVDHENWYPVFSEKVGGLIECVYRERDLPSRHLWQVYANEESRLLGMLPNYRANVMIGQHAVDYEPVTRIYAMNDDFTQGNLESEIHPFPDQEKGMVCGDAIFCGDIEATPDGEAEYLLSLTELVLEGISTYLQHYELKAFD